MKRLLTALVPAITAAFTSTVLAQQQVAAQPPKLGSLETTDEDCKRAFSLAAEGKSASDKDEAQFEVLTLIQCSLLAQNRSSDAESDYVGLVGVGKDGKAHVQVHEIAKDAAKQEGDVRKTCEVLAKGVAGIAAPVNPAAAAYAGTFGVAQCAPMAREVAKKNPLVFMLPPGYVGPYVLAKGGWKGVRQAARDFAKEASAILPKDDRLKPLAVGNPAAAVALAATSKVCKKLKLSKRC